MIETLYGRKVIINDIAYPKMCVSEGFKRLQDPRLVARTQAWMTEFFGQRKLIPDGQVILDETRNAFIMNSTTYKAACTALEPYRLTAP